MDTQQIYTTMGWLVSKSLDDGVVTIRNGGGAETFRVPPDMKEFLGKVPEESSVKVNVRRDSDPATVVNLELIHSSDPFPIDLQRTDGQDLRNRHLWMRSEKMRAIIRARHKILKAIRERLDLNGFISVQTPVTTAMECVCSGTIFKIPFYDQEVFLNQSPWMYVDNLLTAADKVYSIMPSFRKEFKPSPYHLAEVWHIQCDQAWLTQEQSLVFEENLIADVIKEVLVTARDELKILKRDVRELESVTAPFPRVTYDEAVKLVASKGGHLEWGEDVDKKSQVLLTESFKGPFFLVEPPHRTTNFFFNKKPTRPEVAMTHDLYAPGIGEIIGGGERVSDIQQLLSNMADFGHDPEDYSWYVEGKRFGAIPHTGFNFGFDRFVMWILGLKNIREVLPFPRIPTEPVYP